MSVCPFVIGIWRRTSSPETFPGSSTGMKYCNTCKSSTSFCFAHLRTSFQVITFLLSWSSEAWGAIHWLELCHLICANWLACGICKFTALVRCMSWCISCSLILLTLVSFHICSDVRGNNLTGTIPEGIGNCTSFEILYVGSGDSFGVSVLLFMLLWCSSYFIFGMQGYFIQPNLWRNTLQHRLPSSSHTVSLPVVFIPSILQQTYVLMHTVPCSPSV